MRAIPKTGKFFFEMMNLKELAWTSCFALTCILGTALQAEDEFYTVSKGSVIHKLAKTETPWVNQFIMSKFPGDWEEDTFVSFEKVKDKDGIAIDLGAWIGTTAIWLSSNFFYVVAIDADSESIKYLEKNLKASSCDNVSICNKAISADGKPVIFGPRKSHGDALNGSTSFIKTFSDSKCDYVVPSLTLAQVVEEFVTKNEKIKGHKVTFIKCDIEGGEEYILENVLQYAAANNIKVLMSFHYDWWKKKNLESFEPLFQKFKSDVEGKTVSAYINSNPFGSVLFVPIAGQ